MLKLGWKAGPEQYPPVELLDYAVMAEQAGFDSIDVSDHFHPWAEVGQACFTWTWLGAAAVKTSKIHLGTGVTCPIIRYHPAIIAQAAATLACFAPGRSFLGVGTGEALNEYSATGQWPEYKIRQEQLAEAIELIRALWTGEKTSYLGVYYQTHQAKLYTRPDEAIPLYVSTLVPESAHFAGQYGDGMMTVGGQEPEVYRQIIKNFEAGAREAGKDPAKMPKLIELGVAYAEDEAAAIDYRKRYWAGTFVPAMFTQKLYTPKMSEDNGAVVGADIVKQKACISADPAEHIKFARQYIELGFDQLYFHSAGPDQGAFIERFGKDVLPELRKTKESKSKKAAQGKK
jgi:coenzyme F420-dependent glucose-6-phosphate dehydrogenase